MPKLADPLSIKVLKKGKNNPKVDEDIRKATSGLKKKEE